MGGISPFQESDIPAVAELSRRIFPRSAALTPQALEARLLEVFFRYPGYDSTIPSLVYKDNAGAVVGFVGVMARRMSFKGDPIRVAVSHHYMVDPDKRSIVPSIELLKWLMSGPQDLTMTDMANDISRTLWERLGGSTSLVHSIHWRRPIRPGDFARSLLQKRKVLSPLLPLVLKPISSLVDAAALRIERSPFHLRSPETVSESITARSLLDAVSEHVGAYSLRPDYDEATLSWLLDVLSRQSQFGSFHGSLVRSAKEKMLGWYLYHLGDMNEIEVVQIGAVESTAGLVLDHLFYEALQKGAAVLTGRADPHQMRQFSERNCFFFPGRLWMLVHSRNPEILHAIHRCDAFISRLEGDLWLV